MHQCSVNWMIFGCGFAMASPILMAQEKVAEPAPQTIEIIGPTAVLQRQNDVAGKIVIDRSEILKYGDATLSDLLRRQPSISVVGADLRLRGMGNGYTQIMINGDPVSTNFNINNLAPESIERIEILRSGTVEQSAQAVAGSINFILRKNVTRGRKQLKIGILKFVDKIVPNASIELADKDAGFSYSLTGSFNRGHNEGDPVTTESLRDANGAVTLRQFYEHFAHDSTRINLAPRLNWTLANTDQITSQSLIFFNDLKLTGNISEDTLLGNPTDYSNNNTLVKVRTAGIKSDLNWTHRFNAATKINAKIGLNYSDRNRDQFFYGYTLRNPSPFIRNIVYDTIDQNINTTGKLSWRFNDRHSFAFGWDGGLVRGIERRKQHDKDVAGIETTLPREDFLADIKRLALFAQDEWDVSNTLQVYVGLRWEGLRTAISGNAVDDTVKDSRIFSPVLQALWTIPGTEKDKLRLALTRTYKVPEPRDLAPYRQTVNNNNGPNNPDYQGNPSLLPELATGLDLGFEHYFAKDGLIGISGFSRRIQNVKINKLYFSDGVWISSKANQGIAVAHGVELEAKLPLRLVWKTGPAIELGFNASRNWSRLESVPGPDNRLADQIPVTANFSIDYEATATHKMGMNFNFQNGGRVKISDVLTSYSNVTRTLDLFSFWKLDKATQFRVSLGNALHQIGVTEQIYQAVGSSVRSTATPSHYSFKMLLDHAL